MKALYLLFFINVFTTYISYGQCPDPKHPDYDALMGLYTSTNGANWINKTGWDGGAAGTNCDPCSGWYDIVCQNGRVTGINLPGNNLSGYISVLSYEELRDIYLQQNEIEGTLPEINSPKLQYIEFSSNNFVSINTFFGINAPLLAVYVLNDNELNDCISSSYNSLCAQGTQVFLDDNPGFNVNSWTNFCTDGTGGCTTTQGTCPDFVQIQNPEEICEGEDFSINITLIGGNPPFRLVLEDEYNPGVDIVVVENVNERNYTFEFNGSSGLPIPSLGAHNYRIGHRIIEPGLIQTCFIDENPVSQDMLVVNSLTATINTYPDNGTGNGGCEISFSPSLFDAYYFNWTGPEAGTIQSNTSPVSITNLPAGLYSLSITKGNGACETIYSFNIDLDNTSNPCNHPDYTNLMKIYNNTGGPNWKRNGTVSDPNNITNGWDKDCDVCNWYGIRCNANNRVICIDLDGIDNCAWDFNSGNNNMTGTIPSLSFEEVEYFNLSNNGLFGSLSGLNLPKVKSLNITDSKLNGNLTDFDFNKPALEEIRLQYSQLSGSIPNFNLPNLKILDLGGNELEGQLPNLFTPNLEYISFGGNKDLIGSIPNYNIPKIHTIYFHNNKLSGNLPPLNIPLIKILNLQENNFSGCIPSIFKTYCLTVTNANFSNNPNLETQSWDEFCSSGIGMCDDGCTLYLDDAITVDMVDGSYRMRDIVAVYNPNCKFSFDANSIDTVQTLLCSDVGDKYVFVYDSMQVKVDSILVTLTDSTAICGSNLDSIVVKQANTLTANIGCVTSPVPFGCQLYNEQSTFTYCDKITSFIYVETNKSFKFFFKTKILQNSNVLLEGRWPENDYNSGAPNSCFSYCNEFSINIAGNYTVDYYIIKEGTNTEIKVATSSFNVLESHPEYLELIKLYDNLNGNNWKNNGTNDEPNSTTKGWAKDCNICNWYGIKCNTNNKVTCIDLDGINNCQWDFNSGNNNLSGTIPDLTFSDVEFFNLSNNGLVGSLSSLSLPKIKSLNITDSKLTGSLTDIDLNLLTLEEIRLQFNQLSGSIPSINLPSLKILDVGGNNLSGSLPDINSPDLRFLSFGTNKLTGSIPAYNFPLLSELYLHNNQLSGKLPEIEIPNIKVLRFENNNLSGCIPRAYKDFCFGITDGNISINPNLESQSWNSFCTSNDGICIDCFEPNFSDISRTLSINTDLSIDLKINGILPDSFVISVLNYDRDKFSIFEVDETANVYIKFDNHFLGTAEAEIEICGIPCKECSKFKIILTDNYVPYIHPTNVISPDGDGSNDVLKFNEDGEISDSELTIFNRWGDIIYRKNEYTNDWDASGYPGGVYFYVLKVKNVVLKNTLTIIK